MTGQSLMHMGGENRYELKPSGDNHGNVQSSQGNPEWRMAKTPGMKNHFGFHLAITYRDEINERTWMVGDIVIVFEHFPSPGQIFVGGRAGGRALHCTVVHPPNPIDAILHDKCRTWKRSNPWYRETGTSHHGHLWQGAACMLHAACCLLQRGVSKAEFLPVEDRDRK